MATLEEIQRARAAAARKDLAQARLILRKVIETDPRSAQAWLAMAEVVERHEYAIDCLKRALALDPGNAMAQARLAKLMARGGPSGAASEGPRRAAKEGEIPGSGQAEEAVPAPEPRPGPRRMTGRAERVVPVRGLAQQSRRPAQEGITSSKGRGKTSAPSSNVERILIVLAALIGGILVCLTLSVLGQRLMAGMAQATPTREDVRTVLIENVRAANAEDLARYMATIHPDSPSYAYTQTTLASAFEVYNLGYELTRAEVLDQSDTQATISFVLTTKKISGPAFRDNRVTGKMYLLKEGGAWKIYNQEIENIEYLD